MQIISNYNFILKIIGLRIICNENHSENITKQESITTFSNDLDHLFFYYYFKRMGSNVIEYKQCCSVY